MYVCCNPSNFHPIPCNSLQPRQSFADTTQNVTGHFLLPGRIDTPFTYRIHRVRDGGSYALRQVSVFQDSTNPSMFPHFSKLKALKSLPDSKTPCFVATMSYKCPENSEKFRAKFEEIGHQSVPNSHLREVYRSVLDGKSPDEHPVAPSADQAWWTDTHSRPASDEYFPGLDCRKVDMAAYNGVVSEGGDGKVADWRQLQFYRIIQEADEKFESEDEEINLHISAHLYASDRNSLFMIQRAYGYQARAVVMASLSHTVIFHGNAERCRMLSKQGKPKWFVQESRTPNTGENRGLHMTRLWDWEKGEIVGTTVQDGMTRFGRENDERVAQNNRLPRRRRAQRTDMEEQAVKGKL